MDRGTAGWQRSLRTPSGPEPPTPDLHDSEVWNARRGNRGTREGRRRGLLLLPGTRSPELIRSTRVTVTPASGLPCG